jgi:hypothetical protein
MPAADAPVALVTNSALRTFNEQQERGASAPRQ